MPACKGDGKKQYAAYMDVYWERVLFSRGTLAKETG